MAIVSENLRIVITATEPLNGRAILDAARELDRQYMADSIVAFEIAEIAASHEQDQIQERRAKPLDQLPDTDQAAFVAHAKACLRMNRPVWRAVQFARMQAAAVDAVRDLAGKWVPAELIEPLALYITTRINAAGQYALDEQTAKPTPREFATALQVVQRRGER